MILRVAIAAAALAIAVGAVVRHGHAADCGGALHGAYRVAAGHGGDAAAIARELRERCRGGDELASAAAALARRHPALAAGLARTATAREPDNARAWLGLAFALRGRDRAGAARAQARATALNPYAAVVAP